MRKQNRNVEIIHSGNQNGSDAAIEKLASLVAKRLSQGQAKPAEEMTTAELTEQVLAQPWMLPREVAYSIMRLLPVSHQEKYTYRYKDFGCFRCGTKDEPHQSLSLCKRCYALLHYQIKAGIVKHARNQDLSPAQLTANLTRSSDNARRILADMPPAKISRKRQPQLPPAPQGRKFHSSPG